RRGHRRQASARSSLWGKMSKRLRQERLSAGRFDRPGGEMRARVRNLDWAATPLGDRAGWSPVLNLCVDLILGSGSPMAIRWGPELVVIYNDAYRDILGDKHPAALGRPVREVWPEIYGELVSLNEAILRGERDAFFAQDQRWIVRRRCLA